jgi:hypothetical protein
MLFGQSVFQSVLTRLKEEDGKEDDGESAAAFRIAGLNGSFVVATPDAPAGTVNAADSYLAILAERSAPEPQLPAEPEAPPPVPEHLLRLSEEEIAEELAIGPSETSETLADKRRQFAKRNHPDGVPAEFRDNATVRMKTANLMIDRAIKDLYWRSS